MRIAVLGGGNGAYAAAADLTERGHVFAVMALPIAFPQITLLQPRLMSS